MNLGLCDHLEPLFDDALLDVVKFPQVFFGLYNNLVEYLLCLFDLQFVLILLFFDFLHFVEPFHFLVHRGFH